MTALQICFKDPDGKHFRYLGADFYIIDQRHTALRVCGSEWNFLEERREDAFVSGQTDRERKVIRLVWVTPCVLDMSDDLVAEQIRRDAASPERNWEPFDYHGQPTEEEMWLLEGSVRPSIGSSAGGTCS